MTWQLLLIALMVLGAVGALVVPCAGQRERIAQKVFRELTNFGVRSPLAP